MFLMFSWEKKITFYAKKKIQSKQVDPFYIKEIIKNQIPQKILYKDYFQR